MCVNASEWFISFYGMSARLHKFPEHSGHRTVWWQQYYEGTLLVSNSLQSLKQPSKSKTALKVLNSPQSLKQC